MWGNVLQRAFGGGLVFFYTKVIINANWGLFHSSGKKKKEECLFRMDPLRCPGVRLF